MKSSPSASWLCRFAAIGMAASAPLTCHARQADVVYVNAGLSAGAGDGTSWANAYRGPQGLKDALDHAVAPAQIWVAAGTYTPSQDDRAASFELHSGVGVYGGFAGGESHLEQRDPTFNVTVLSGDLDGEDINHGGIGADNAFVVVLAIDCDEAARLDGFTIFGAGEDQLDELGLAEANVRIRGGGPRIVNCVILDVAEAATAMVDIIDASPVISNCRFDNATANMPMAPMILNRAGGAPMILDCDFVSTRGPLSTGLALQNGEITRFGPPGPPRPVCRAVVRGCAFTGWASVRDESELTIERCDFDGPQRAIISNGTRTAIDACTFRACESFYNGGSAITVGDFPPPERVVRVRASNCLFSGNDRESGRSAVGFMGVNDFSWIELVNCTLVSNGRSDRAYSAIAHTGRGSVRLRNCVLWANDSSHQDVNAQLITFPQGAPRVFVDNSCLQYWDASFPGGANIGLDPRFVDLDGADTLRGTPDDNLRLGAGSPCIDAGRNAFVSFATPYDLAGLPRIADGDFSGSKVVDMGAYERPRQFSTGSRRPLK